MTYQEQWYMESSKVITLSLLNSPEYQNSRRIHIYWPPMQYINPVGDGNSFPKNPSRIKHEPDTQYIINHAKKSSRDIFYPDSNPFRNETNLDIIIVPGTKFDYHMNRKGRGGGYYDKFLEKTKAIKVGLTFTKNLVDRLFTNHWDIPMDVIISEKGIIRDNKESIDKCWEWKEKF